MSGRIGEWRRLPPWIGERIVRSEERTVEGKVEGERDFRLRRVVMV